MYRVSEANSSGGGVVPGAVGDSATGCWSGCGIALDMMGVVDACVVSRGGHWFRGCKHMFWLAP